MTLDNLAIVSTELFNRFRGEIDALDPGQRVKVYAQRAAWRKKQGLLPDAYVASEKTRKLRKQVDAAMVKVDEANAVYLKADDLADRLYRRFVASAWADYRDGKKP